MGFTWPIEVFEQGVRVGNGSMPCRFVGVFVNARMCYAAIDWDIAPQPGEESAAVFGI